MSTEFRDADPQTPGEGEPQGTADAPNGEAVAVSAQADGSEEGSAPAGASAAEATAGPAAAGDADGAGLSMASDDLEIDVGSDLGEDLEDLENVDELDEMAELDEDDFELLGASAADGPSAPPPTPHAAPPPTPSAHTPPQRLPTAGPPATPRPPRAPSEHGQVSAALAEAPPPPPPIESLLEQPTCLERELEALATRAVQSRVEALRADLAHATDKQQLAALAYELGELSSRRLDDEAAAVKAHGQALAADPSLRANLWAIRRVFYRRALWPNLIKLLDAEVRYARDDVERAGLLYEKGVLLEDQLEQPGEAREAFERAFALDPRNGVVLRALERIAAKTGDLALLEQVWLAELDCAEQPATKVAIILDLVEVLSERGTDGLERARDLLSDAVALGADPGRVGRARIRLAELLEDGEELISALDARVVQLFATVGPAGLPDAPSSARAPGTPLDRNLELRLHVAALRRRQAQVARLQLDDGDRAWDYLQQALTMAPGEPLILADLADLAERLERFDELAALVDGWSSVEGDPNRTLALSIRRIDALMRADKHEQARALIEVAASSAPGHLAVVAVAEREALARGDRGALARAWMSAGEAFRLGTALGPGVKPASGEFADVGRASGAFFIAAGDAFLDAGEPAQAIVAFQRAAEAEPSSAAVAEALADAYEAAAQPAEARAVLASMANDSTGEGRRYLLERVARLCKVLDDSDGLIAAERAICALDPADARTRWRLEHALGALGRHGERVEVLLEITACESDPARRSHAAVLAARLCEDALGDTERAVGLFRQAIELSPDDAYARGSLLELMRGAPDRQAWAATLVEEFASAPDGPRALIAGRELADVQGHELSSGATAAATLADVALRFPLDAQASAARLGWLAKSDNEADYLDALELATAEAEGPAGALALARWATELERSGRSADAIEAYRRLLQASPGDVIAALGLLELGEAEADSVAVFEALEALAASPASTGTSAAIWEEIGWRRAVQLEDFDGAQAGFSKSLELDGSRQGAALGLSMIAGRREDRAASGVALATMAGQLAGEADRAALYLRSAALAEAEGHHEVARSRARAALQAAPGDASTVIAAAEFLPLAWHRQREFPAAELAEALGQRAVLASDDASDDWSLDRAEVLEMAGAMRAAATIANEVLRRRPRNLRALSLLRRVYARSGEREGLARVSVALAKTLGDAEAKLGLLREAAAIFDGELARFEFAVPVYRRILGADAGAPEFHRLLNILREHDDLGGRVELLSQRLAWLEGTTASGHTVDDAVPLWVERARLRRAIGDARGAGRDFERALAVDPLHAVALRESAEVSMSLGDTSRAAEYLRRFLEIAEDPGARDAAELALATLLAENLDDVAGAIFELDRVIEHHPDNIEYRERVVVLASRSGDWERAIAEIEEIERRRRNDAERARDVLRIAHIFRDQLADEASARKAFDRARGLDPLNLDAVRDLAELAGRNSKAERHTVLRQALADLRLAATETPGKTSLYERLAAVSSWVGDDDTRLFSLSSLAALGTLTAEQQAALDGLLDRRAGRMQAAVPAVLGTELRNSCLVAGVDVVASELWAAIAPAISSARGVTPDSLGFSRGDRVASKQVAARYPAVAAAMESLGVAEVDLYVGSSRPGVARAIAGEVPRLCLGADVAKAESGVSRFNLARAIAEAQASSGGLVDLSEEEVLGWFAAAAHETEAHPSGELAQLVREGGSIVQERARSLHRAMSRKERKHLAGLAGYFTRLADPRGFRRAAILAAARTGLLFSSDLEAALSVLDVGRGGKAIADDPVATQLLAWSVGEAHQQLRRALGVALGELP